MYTTDVWRGISSLTLTYTTPDSGLTYTYLLYTPRGRLDGDDCVTGAFAGSESVVSATRSSVQAVQYVLRQPFSSTETTFFR